MIFSGGLLIITYHQRSGSFVAKGVISLRTRAKIYINLISLAGIYLFIRSACSFFAPYVEGGEVLHVHMLIIPILVCALCRSLPLTVHENETLDLSVISVLAVYLTQGAAAAVTIYVLSSFFTFTPVEDSRKYKPLLSLGLQKFFFNDATIILSIVLPAMFLNAVSGWTPGRSARVK